MKMKKTAALFAALMSLTALTVNVNAESTSTLPSSYKSKYRQILQKAEEDESISGVYIGDLVGDEREELIIAHNEFGYSTLYVPVGKNKLRKYTFDVVSVWGFTKYIKGSREIICMNNYGHTTGAPYALEMEMLSVEDDSFSNYTLKRDWNEEGTGTLSLINGKEVTDADFATALNALIAETARSEYIPYVKYNSDSMPFGEGETTDIDYETYISEKLS